MLDAYLMIILDIINQVQAVNIFQPRQLPETNCLLEVFDIYKSKIPVRFYRKKHKTNKKIIIKKKNMETNENQNLFLTG